MHQYHTRDQSRRESDDCGLFGRESDDCGLFGRVQRVSAEVRRRVADQDRVTDVANSRRSTVRTTVDGLTETIDAEDLTTVPTVMLHSHHNIHRCTTS